MPDAGPIVALEDATKDYALGATVVHALRGATLEVQRGEFMSIVGPSGSGKTTLLNLIGCVDTPTSGRVVVDGRDTSQLRERELTRLRLYTVGFIFQSFNLVHVLDVYRNVELPLLLQGELPAKERKARVLSLLEQVGLHEHIRHRPSELSGGQRQRVAIARALVTRPKLVLADEPTANLDSVTGGSILDLMKDLNRLEHTTFIFSTHDPRVMAHASSRIHLVDGQVVEAESTDDPPTAATSAGLG